jgi:hypothetical protein
LAHISIPFSNCCVAMWLATVWNKELCFTNSVNLNNCIYMWYVHIHTILTHLSMILSNSHVIAIHGCVAKDVCTFCCLSEAVGNLKKNYICLKYFWNLDVWPGEKLHLPTWKLTTLDKICPMRTKRKCDE